MPMHPRRVLCRLFLVALVVVAVAQVEAQTPIGTLYTIDFVDGNVGVFTQDPSTGDATLVVITDAISISDSSIAFDANTRRLFFRSGADLYTVNVDTASYSHVAAIGSNLEFDPAGQLYTVAQTDGFVTVYALDPATGAATPVATTDSSSLAGGASTFDPIQRRFFFRGSSAVYMVDVVTGTFTHFPAPGLSIDFDTGTGEVYALDHVDGDVTVFATNPMNGITRTVVTTDGSAISSNASAFDPAGRRLFFRSSGRLYTVNVDPGAFSRVPSSGSFALVFASSHSNIPTLSMSAAMLLAAFLACLAVTMLRSSA